MIKAFAVSAAAIALAGCVTSPTTESGFLTDYARLSAPSQDGAATARSFRDEAALKGVTRVSIAPTQTRLAQGSNMTADAIGPVVAEIDAELCRELSERFEITDDPAAPQVRAAITGVQKTDAAASAISAAASRAIPGPFSVRLPVGLGGLNAEAEIVDRATGAVLAAISWSRRAQAFMSSGSLSAIGDAHQKAEPFADAVGALATVAGQTPPAKGKACPGGIRADDAGRFVAARLTGLHFVPGVDAPVGVVSATAAPAAAEPMAAEAMSN